MKTNKKAILGMLVAMVMSLGVMGGINIKSNDSNLQQYCVLVSEYHPGTREMLAEGGSGFRVFWNSTATLIGAGIAILNPWVGLGYAL
jgi:hypothetical protein